MQQTSGGEQAAVTTIATRWLGKLRQYRPGQLAKGSAYALVGSALRTLIQLALFVALARALGAEDFGVYAAAVAVGALLAPVALLGSGPRLLRDVAQQPGLYPDRLAEALVAWLWTAPLITLSVAVAAAWLGLGTSWVLIILSEALAGSLVTLLCRCWQAHDRLAIMAGVQAGLALCRLGLAFGLLLFTALTLEFYASGVVLISLLYAALAIAVTQKRLGRPRWRTARISTAFRAGRTFMTITLTQAIGAEANKPLLLGMIGAPAAGIFTAAQRAIGAATLPIEAFMAAAAPRIHRAQGGRDILGKMLPVPVAGTALICIAVWAAAPLLAWMLGSGYEPTASAVRLFAAMPLVSLLKMAAITAVIGAGRQRYCMYLNFLAAAMSVALTLALVPDFGLEGAICALYLAEGVTLIAAWWALLRSPNRPAR